jgi:hypothetical protein
MGVGSILTYVIFGLCKSIRDGTLHELETVCTVQSMGAAVPPCVLHTYVNCYEATGRSPMDCGNYGA